MPGYQLADSGKAKIDDKYFCTFCKLLLREAMQTSCGHFYCQSCLGNLVHSRDLGPVVMVCPVDKQELCSNEVFADNFLRREVFAIMVHCTFMEDGCQWKGEVRHLEDHTSSCDYLKVPCVYPECGMLVKKGLLREHLENECLYLLVECELCHAQTLLNRMTLHQENECSAYPVVCDKCSKEGIPRGKILPTYVNVIQNLLNQMQSSSEAMKNLQERSEEYNERITSSERQLASVNISDASPSSQRLPGTEGSLPNTDTTRRLTNLENKTAEYEKLLVENIRTTQEIARRMERRMESIEHTLALRNVTLADLEEYVRRQEFSSYDGQLIWKITDYARRRNEAVSGQQVSFYSPCFYTGRYGYKMCAQIYLNGDGMGRGTHVSIFLVLMRGEHDALLRWPFSQKVTFMLFDQDNVEHVIETFRPDPNSSSFQRPRRETNIASGCPMFCSLTELNNHTYVRNDTMYLKIIVEAEDASENLDNAQALD